MAKGNGLFGNFRKKIGNTVGYTLKNSNNRQTQGVRIYQPVVSNPKSNNQSAQRMKLMPLQIFYQSFSDVLNHAFEGKKVGQMNRQRFMQLNMPTTAGLAPAVQKGERVLAPIKCQVSSGSLTVDTSMVPTEDGGLSPTLFLYGGTTPMNSIGTLTLKQFTDAVVASNLGLESGMEVAFIFVVASTDDVRAGVPLKFSIVLDDADSDTTIADLMGNVANYIAVSVNGQGAFEIISIDDDTALMGAAIIISKKNASGWANNNARFYATNLGESVFYDNDLYLAALATYGPSGSTLTSDLFLRQADNAVGAADPNAIVTADAQAIVLTGDYEQGVLSAANAIIAKTRAGYSRLTVNAEGTIVDTDGTPITVTTGSGSSEATVALKPEMTSFSGLRTVQYGSFTWAG